MRSGLALLALLTACAPAVGGNAMPPRAVADRDAREVIGAVAVVTGEVAQVKTGAHHGFAYLNFGGRFPAHTFAVLIPDSVISRFGDLTRFEGRRARVTGRVWLQDEKYPAVTVTDPAVLELLP